jgi:hypothetical protein
MTLAYTDSSGEDQTLVYQCCASLGYKLFSGCKVPVSVITSAADASMYKDKTPDQNNITSVVATND